MSLQEQVYSLVVNKYVGIAIGSIIFLNYSVKMLLRLRTYMKKRSYPKDVVILHQFPRSFYAPSASPFVLKLETWLRMANIKYQNEHGYLMGPKGKVPWITYNGVDIPDSQFVIEYLGAKFGKDFSSNFSPKDQGAARAFLKMAEESLFWISGMDKFLFEKHPDKIGLPWAILYFLGMTYKKRTFYQGYGRHNKEEVYSIAKKDLKSINDFLAGKRFLLGDKVCNEDAALFGVLSQFVYYEVGPIYNFIKYECPNIIAYLNEIKTVYWPDWNDCITDKSKKKTN